MSTSFIHVNEDQSLIDVLKLLNDSGYGICFVLKNKKVVGTITDGDIRRSLLKGQKLNISANVIMNKNYHAVYEGASDDEIHELLLLYHNVPLLNKNKEIITVLTKEKFSKIPIIQPMFNGNELEYVKDCINSGWISSKGRYVSNFERKFEEYTENQNALAVSSGTTALHLALHTLGVGQDDEVIVPDITFAAVINAVIYVGAKPVIVDVNYPTMTINVNNIAKSITNKTKAIIAVHLYGFPAEIDEILNITKEKNIFLIEDCAEALGTFKNKKHVGQLGDASTYSFFGNKTITTGEGGMLSFKDRHMSQRAEFLRDHGMSKDKRYWHSEVGFNYRMTNLQAAVGLAQLERIEFFLSQKKRVAQLYEKYLSSIPGIIFPPRSDEIDNSYWLYNIILPKEIESKRDRIMELLSQGGIECRPIFYPLHKMPPYKTYQNKSNYNVSSEISKRGIALPTSVNLDDHEIEYICDRLILAING